MLPTQQSREALDAAWHAVANHASTGRTALATVRVDSPFVEAGMLPERFRARRPDLVRIDFLRN